MSAFAKSGLAVAMRRLNAAIEKIETYCDGNGEANVAPLMGEAFAHLLDARGEITAVQQLLDLEYEMERAPTERPKLTVIK